MEIQNIEDKAAIIAANAVKKEQLYTRLNQVYDKINMKTGLIQQGFNTVMMLLLPYLNDPKRNK